MILNTRYFSWAGKIKDQHTYIFATLGAKSYGKLAALTLSALAATLGFSRLVHAIDTPGNSTQVSVRVESKPNLVSAKGIVFSAQKSFEVADTTITKIGDKLFEVSFQVPRARIQPDSVASVLATDENGDSVFGGVTPALLSEATNLLASVPECPGEDSSRSAAGISPGALKQLVDVRAERMEIVRIKIRRSMDANFVAKLKKFEEAFGLTRTSDLSPELPSEELIDRLSRIQHALRKYQAYRPKQSR